MDEAKIARRDDPADVVVVERTEWGLLIGSIKEVREGGRVLASGPVAGLAEVRRRLPSAADARRDIKRLEKGEIGAINHAQEKIRLGLKRLELQGVTRGAEVDALQQELGRLQARYKEREASLADRHARALADIVAAAAA